MVDESVVSLPDDLAGRDHAELKSALSRTEIVVRLA
jgi:hypothetical protein